MKVVINSCFGGFGVSGRAALLCIERGMTATDFDAKGAMIDEAADFVRPKFGDYTDDFYAPKGSDKAFRSNPILVAVVEELGAEASGQHAELES